MITYIPVAGTSGWADDSAKLAQYGRNEVRWWQDSYLYYFLKAEGFNVPNVKDPYIWTTDLGGTSFWRRWAIWKGKISLTRDHRDWIAGGAALRWYIKGHNLDDSDVNIIAHSHGLQVVAYASEQGLKINHLISVGSPVRRDMEEVYKRMNVRRWLHIFDGNNDRIQWAGQLGDGFLSRRLKNSYANFNHPLPNIEHSRVLSDPDAFHYWKDMFWLDFLRTGWDERIFE
jgi:hypothetical protein